MKYAICNYERGKQVEISICDIDKNGYRYRKLHCPECGEAVFPKCGAKNAHTFSHHKKTEFTPECDKRVDGRSELTVYQRIGLPVYIRNESNGHFSLSIGFWPLGQDLLKETQQKQISVCIKSQCSWQKQKDTATFHVDSTRFSADTTAYMPVDFAPTNGMNYEIALSALSATTTIRKLERKWSNYADGFSDYGAIFSYSETGGKKIRRNDPIEIGGTYYWVSIRNTLPPLASVSGELLGSVILERGNSLFVFRVNIGNHSLSDSEYDQLSDFIMSKFHLNLLYAIPEIIPMWPPAIQKSDSYCILPFSSTVTCSIKSGNDIPKVYEYISTMAIEVQHYQENKSQLIILLLGDTKKLITVDRKYSGNGYFITKQSVIYNGFQPEILVAVDGEPVELDGLIPVSCKEKTITIVSNTKLQLYTKTAEQHYMKKTIDTPELSVVQQISNSEELLAWSASHELNRWRFIQLEKDVAPIIAIDDATLYLQLQHLSHGAVICSPNWLSHIVVELISAPRCQKLIGKYCIERKIPYGIVAFLRSYFKGVLK